MKEIRARQFMYTQDLAHLKIKIDNLQKTIERCGCNEWAYIVHDKDHGADGNLIRPHLHLVLKFKNPQILDHVAKIFKDQPQYLEIWHGRINNAYSYLLHETTGAHDKHRYDAHEVHASFDFNSKINQIRGQNESSSRMSRQAVDNLLTQYADKSLTYDELEHALGKVEFAKKEKIINYIALLNAQEEHQRWLKSFQGQAMETHWLWGSSGVGKTRYARWLTEGNRVAVLGSSRDYFQEYKGERFVILNDLRPNDFKYGDLLRLLDPYELDKMAPRRYKDVPLNIEMLIITTPYSPLSFYKESYISNRRIDTFDQLQRRIHAIHITKEFMKEVMPDEYQGNIEWEGFTK